MHCIMVQSTLILCLCLLPPSPSHVLSRVVWDFVIISVLVFTLILLPVGLAFYSEDQLEPQWLVPNITVDCIFMLDILVIFRTIRISKKVRHRVSVSEC
jgi:hypothetical protein